MMLTLEELEATNKPPPKPCLDPPIFRDKHYITIQDEDGMARYALLLPDGTVEEL